MTKEKNVTTFKDLSPWLKFLVVYGSIAFVLEVIMLVAYFIIYIGL